MTDPIADMLTRIRNAQAARLASVQIPASKLKMAIAGILVEEGFLTAMKELDGTPKMLELSLKYVGKQPAIQSIARESKPGHRCYVKADQLPRILNDYGVAIVSTSKGLMTNKKARKEGIGGEIICSVY